MAAYFLGILIGLTAGSCLCFIVMKGRENKIVYEITMQQIKDAQIIQDVNDAYYNPNLSYEEKFDRMYKAIFKDKES